MSVKEEEKRAGVKISVKFHAFLVAARSLREQVKGDDWDV